MVLDIASVCLGVLGIIVTILVYYSVVNKKLQKLLADRQNEFTKLQAIDFSIIYIDFTCFGLELALNDFLNKIEQGHIMGENIQKELVLYMFKVAESWVDKRAQTTRFFLINGTSYSQFIETVHEEKIIRVVNVAKDELRELVALYENGDKTLDQIRTHSLTAISAKADMIKEIVKLEISNIYKYKE